MKNKLIALLLTGVAVTAFSMLLCGCAHEHEHEYSLTGMVAPTCIERGHTIHSCECGDSYTKEYGDLVAHTPATLEGLAATCTEAGYTEKTYCYVCGKVLEDSQIIPAKGHVNGAVKVVKQPTCTEDGLKQSECKVCNFVSEQAITATGHRYSYAASADQSGKCAVCDSEIQFVPRAGNSSYGFNDFFFEKKGAAMQTLYQRIYTLCEEFTESQRDLTEADHVDWKGYEGVYIVGYVSMSGLNLTTTEAVSVWKVFMIENPAYFWLNSNTTVNYRGVAITTTADYMTYAERQQYQKDINDMARECSNAVKIQQSELETALTIYDYILDKMEYAYNDDGKPEQSLWAHSLVGIASHGAGVCETYAKAYAYLCALNGIECIIVSGNTINHAWNYVRIDGVWYGADLTKADLDTSGEKYVYMGMSASDLAKEHVPDKSNLYGINYLYHLPPVSEEKLQIENP